MCGGCVCGGCGVRPGVDWAAPFLGSLPARSAAARVVVAAAARPVDVRAAAGGWTVRRPTGASSVAGTLTALVGDLRPRADAEVGLPAALRTPLPGPDRRRPVVLVHGAAPGPVGVDAGAAGWAEQLMGGTSACVVAVPGDPRPVLHALLGDPLRRHVRVEGLDSATLPGWGPPAGPLPGIPAVVDPDQVPALVALLAVRLAGRPDGERTRTRVAAGRTAVVLDALGPTALAACTTSRAPEGASAQAACVQDGAGPRPSRQRAASSEGL